jgi:hypothetical protein
MADEKPAQKSEAKADDAFKPKGRPTAREVAEKAAKDERVEEAPDFGGSE